jgi:hypothetical protein
LLLFELRPQNSEVEQGSINHYNRQMQLAQLNIARLAYPLESPEMQDFVLALNAINLLAEESPGFVWRLKGEGNNATDVQMFNDPSLIVNLSVWADFASLKHYVYNSGHAHYLKRRREWFVPLEEAGTVLWWIPDGHLPSVPQAQAKLEHLRTYGSTTEAFGINHAVQHSSGA